ncbi:DUF397 domain-containing protein [Streptomyces sp. NPDC048483]|uniref:DUF397 domain-containing protein n=1 Tax=Streptomyces sp. NPDC048483 TaxID=3154927 RepID=UPI003441184F
MGDGGQECIELAALSNGLLIRESDAPDVITATSARALRALVHGIKGGEFDQASPNRRAAAY